jgi:hypothetical protein
MALVATATRDTSARMTDMLVRNEGREKRIQSNRISTGGESVAGGVGKRQGPSSNATRCLLRPRHQKTLHHQRSDEKNKFDTAAKSRRRRRRKSWRRRSRSGGRKSRRRRKVEATTLNKGRRR